MGAGFAIAMRDLEIRGAGNILGTQQSGHIAVVGYELYCDLLQQAVQHLKRQPPKQAIEVDVDLPGEGHIPRSYVPDMRLKIDLYRRLGRISSFDELRDLRSELRDRFGPRRRWSNICSGWPNCGLPPIVGESNRSTWSRRTSSSATARPS